MTLSLCQYFVKRGEMMTDNLPRYTLRVDRDLLDKLDYIAKSEGRTKNKEIEQLIKKRVAESELEHGVIDLNDK